jgi:predicted aspartyl protease
MSAPVSSPLEVSQGHIFAPVRIAGHTYRFLIDSGSQDIVVDARVAAQLGLRAVGAIEASGATRTGGLQVARLSDLTVGGAQFRNLVVSTIDLGASTDGAFRIDGILGYPSQAAR